MTVLTAADIDPDDLEHLPARHYLPLRRRVLGTIVDAGYDPQAGEWHAVIADTSQLHDMVDLNGAAIAAAGGRGWRPHQIARVELGDWDGQGWAATIRGLGVDDVLALPHTDMAVPQIVERVELLVS